MKWSEGQMKIARSSNSKMFRIAQAWKHAPLNELPPYNISLFVEDYINIWEMYFIAVLCSSIQATIAFDVVYTPPEDSKDQEVNWQVKFIPHIE